MAKLEKLLLLDCTSESCVIARNSEGGHHEVKLDSSDPSIKLFEDEPGHYAPNAIGSEGPENEILGTLIFNCPDSGAGNQKTYIGESGKYAMGKLATSGIVPQVVGG